VAAGYEDSREEKSMATIVDLSNEPKFTIKAAAWQTGIRPVTLRAWERRHDILNPHRTDNHYRLYSERDIAILRWLKYRVDEGVSIRSAVNELRSMTSKSIWPEALPHAPVPAPVAEPGNFPPAHYARQLSQALIKHDECLAGDLLREILAQYDLILAFTEIISPVTQSISYARYHAEISAADERFASAYLRSKLLSLLQAYPSRSHAPLALVGCAPMETHELNSLMLSVLLRSEGYRVEYLGPDIPIEDLADYAGDVLPTLVVLSASSDFTARETRRMQDMLKTSRSTPIFAYCGEAFESYPKLRGEIPGKYLGNRLDEELFTAKELLRSRQKSRH
jgi:MerR family transcriptional regulator, light-induced transcriptional regulator